MTTLVLTGFMGTGKTTVGQLLADRFGLEFVDTDNEIERRAGKSIPDIFASDGEATFRRLESLALNDVRAKRGVVIATGGGALVSEENRALFGHDHTVICLTCGLDEIEQRIGDPGARPLLAGRTREEIRSLFETRKHVYQQFEQIDTSDMTVGEVAEQIACRLNLSSFTLRFDPTRTTTVLFERGILDSLGCVLRQRGLGGPCLVVTDDRVLEAIGRERLLHAVGEQPSLTVLKTGEANKTLESVQIIYEDCLKYGLDRSGTVIGIGGGVIGDIAGFAAATYMRGVQLVLVPTTLLAQVDAAFGGKVAADFAGVKNLVGSFYPANTVIIDPDVLSTLSDAALADGLAEIVKISAILSEDLLQAVEGLDKACDVLDTACIIRRSASLKVQVVERDPYDRGERALLNFGHTIGHAVEAASGYQLSHGQAIAIGMIAETWLAERIGVSDDGLRDRLEHLLRRFELPVCGAGIDVEEAMTAMLRDKKRRAGELWFALAVRAGTGTAFAVSEADARAALEYAVEGTT